MTEEQLLKIYNSILEENHELTDILVNQNLVSKTRSLELVYEYGISKENKEAFIEKFKIYKEHTKSYYIIAMKEIKKYKETGEVDLYNYEENSKKFTQFINTFPQYKETIEEICNKVNKMKYEFDMSFLGRKLDEIATYEEEFYMIYKSKNPIEVYRKFDWNETIFNRKIQCFKRRYQTESDKKLIAYFEEQFKLYLEKYKKVKKENLPFQCNTDNYSLAKAVIDDLIASDKSIYEYCHEHLEYNALDIKRFIRIVYTELGAGANKPDQIIKELENKEKSSFISDLKYIAHEINNNPNFTIVDYYLLTKLSLDDFKVKIKDVYNKQIAIFIGTNSKWLKTELKTTLESELKIKNIINDREITNEEKILMFKWLEENQIPANKYTYNWCIKKLIKEDFDFTQKIYVYKGSN